MTYPKLKMQETFTKLWNIYDLFNRLVNNIFIETNAEALRKRVHELLEN